MRHGACREVKVLEVVPLGQSKRPGEFFELRLELPDWEAWRPGQFVMLRPLSWGLELVWGRPFSIASADRGVLCVLFQALGRGTRRLAGLRPGDQVLVWGPLGNGFAVDSGKRTLILAGGMGLAPFRAYVERHPAPDLIRLFFAHRFPLECYPFDYLSGLVDAVRVEERSPGDLALVIDALRAEMAAFDQRGLILACGPTPFLGTVRDRALELGLAERTQLSLEERMACGVGACLGCAVKDAAGGNVQVCSRGPVFWAGDVQLGRG
ncbi:MAG: dihydroorotate dehydrogenase electron transfer subunit [Desulfovibrionaceae bacterium]|nr:dihydroorotate dehydrogenase electron transfer subunit [Desulfovibrionaceae bacterium]